MIQPAVGDLVEGRVGIGRFTQVGLPGDELDTGKLAK
jgi:hypothetical protein